MSERDGKQIRGLILAISQNEDYLGQLEAILSSRKFGVITVNSHQWDELFNALKACKETFRAIVVDFDSVDLVSIINKQWPTTGIIVLTPDFSYETVSRSRFANPKTELVIRPFLPVNELVAKVEILTNLR